jgi:molybdopterin/thiamine biosynthesis adenylyltransferase
MNLEKIARLANMALSPEELERYARHIVLREVGGQGQQKLKAARVLVIGCGRRRHHRRGR